MALRLPTQNSRCCPVFGWIIQFLIWGGIAFIALSINESYLATLIIIFVILYVTYIITMFCNMTLKYLSNLREDVLMNELMGTYFKASPQITFNAECYHYETRASRKRKVTVITHRDTLEFPYYSTKDVSGLFFLDLGQAQSKRKSFIKLDLETEIHCADPISYSDYIICKESFWKANRYYDKYMRFIETRIVPGLQEHNMIIIGKKPCSVNKVLYILFIFIPFAQLYALYVNSFCITQQFKVRKLISTRYNLANNEYDEKYNSFHPALKINTKMYSYDRNNTRTVFESYQPKDPTENELEVAQQYNSYVPQYKIDSNGMIQNGYLPSNLNYNLPPPSFNSLGGDVELSNEQLRPPPQIHEGGYSSHGILQNPNANIIMNPNNQKQKSPNEDTKLALREV